MPECDALYLIWYLFEIGPVSGETPISHTEIRAWQDNTGIDLNSWEARCMRSLSIEYLSESQKATAPESPSPWIDAPYARTVSNITALIMQQSIIDLVNS